MRHRLGALASPALVGAHPVEPPAQHRGRHQRGREDHQQECGVEVPAEDPLAEADGGEDEADLSAGDHPDADEQLVAWRADGANRREELPDDRHGEEPGRDPEHLRLEERLDASTDPDLEEEHRDEQVTNRGELALDALGRRAAGQREACDECSDDRRELRSICELREAERERERDRDEGSSGSGVAVQELEHAGCEPRPDERRHDEEPDRDEQDQCDVGDRDGPFGDQPNDHREDHEPEHVVGDRGAQHRARFDGREGTQVAEHPRGDPHARGGQRRADEQRLVAAVPEGIRHRVATGHRQDDADTRDRQRGSADRAEVGDVHLHADAEQQQDDPQLAEDAQGLVRPDEAQDRRTDDDAGDDLAHDGRDVDPFSELGGDLRRDEYDENVEEN